MKTDTAIKATLGLMLALLVVSLALPGTSRAASPAPQPDRVVFATGVFPADVENVQAAVSLGGLVLLKATDIAGQPTAFNFGDFSGSPPPVTDDEFFGSGGVFVTTDVEIVGETLTGARTTVIGGRNAIRSFDPVRIAVRGIHFAGPRMHAIYVRSAAQAEITGNRFTDLRPVLQVPALGITFALAAQSLDVGSVTVSDNVVDGVIADNGQGLTVAGFGTAVVARNTIRNVGGSGVLAYQAGTADRRATALIVDNVIEPGPERTPFTYGGLGIVAGISLNASFAIKGNVIRCENSFADGIALIRGPNSAFYPVGDLADSTVTNNHVVMHRSTFGGGISIYDRGSHNYIGQNRIEGDAAWGLGILRIFWNLPADGNVFVGNDLSQLSPAIAHVLFDVIAQDNVLTGNGGSVVDLGTGNQITGVSKIGYGQPIGPQIGKHGWWFTELDRLPHAPQRTTTP
jgi:hypothetical protein